MKIESIDKTSARECLLIKISDDPDSFTYYCETLALKNTKFVTMCRLKQESRSVKNSEKKKHRQLIISQLTAL